MQRPCEFGTEPLGSISHGVRYACNILERLVKWFQKQASATECNASYVDLVLQYPVLSFLACCVIVLVPFEAMTGFTAFISGLLAEVLWDLPQL